MSDNNCGFTKDQFLAVLHRFGPELSAHEIAHLGKVSLRQVLCCAHHHQWELEQIAGETGWLYRKRDLREKAMVRPIRKYMDEHDPMKTGYGRHREVVVNNEHNKDGRL